MHGTTRESSPDPRAELSADITCHHVDLRERPAVEALVGELRPRFVVHLAAQSSPAASWEDPAGTIANNAGSEANLLDALTRLKPMPRVLVVGSGDEYGRPAGRARRLNEETPLRPVTPYGVSKVTQDVLALQYHLSHGLPAVRVRPFNHAGPRQSPQFAVSSFAQQVARIERGKQEPVLRVGNLQAQRDFTDVRDVVRGYWLALQKGRAGEVYNIGSGTAVRLRAVVDLLLGMTRVRIRLEVDPRRARAVEADVYLCDPRRFHRRTGWRPRITLERTVRDTLGYWRKMELAAD